MSPSKRTAIKATLALSALSLCVGIAHAADAYPSQPIKLIVPFPPGEPTDVMGRIAVAPWPGDRDFKRPLGASGRPD